MKLLIPALLFAVGALAQTPPTRDIPRRMAAVEAAA